MNTVFTMAHTELQTSAGAEVDANDMNALHDIDDDKKTNASFQEKGDG